MLVRYTCPNSHRGVLHADCEDGIVEHTPQGVRQVGPLRGKNEAKDLCTHFANVAAPVQHKYVYTLVHNCFDIISTSPISFLFIYSSKIQQTTPLK